ncbi:MAG: cardiolipin synthase ClsB [Candidatus Competibacteraceae bacterium]|nr:cardiolipin synthase ClsB [Candidatus Competibacteraceae bacterium]
MGFGIRSREAEKKGKPAVTRMMPDNHISLLQSGEAYFQAIEAAMDGAMYDIYLETYIFEDDSTGRRIAEALKRAALRGVRTHLLIDGYGSIRLPKSVFDDLEAVGVLVMKFRPKTSPWTLRRRRLRRLHRKIMVVDRTIAFVGGININDGMDRHGRPSTQFDYAVSVQGPLVKAIHDSVRKVWSRVAWMRWLPGRSRENARYRPSTESTGVMQAAFLVRNNIRHRRDIEEAYLRAIELAQREIILANAYFLPGLNFRHALVDAAGRGVRVILLLQGERDHPLFQYASHALYGSFLAAGIEIYEYHKSLLHAKVAVIDGHWATVGSSNLDPFSMLLSLEANVVVDDEGFAQELKLSLEQAMETGAQRIDDNSWRNQSIGQRLASWLSYGVVRFMIGIAGYAPGKRFGRAVSMDHSA